ncbi:shugoshin [Colletotrichum higginsianum]|uniref:Shugoshin n=1 Tax=Colletotrichum higginsianum (strain IMI 349063) TaxID=759273 RepID=H1VY91_COLHI|nr:Shugoshin [Colletotrichum higginsianum IMI 349063]OBR03659.1 Shugoshin [Colletotrichum higginsianum IMI 349063]CCF45203.1 shugoshin [Colletotrichum higginsianum]
MARLNEPPVSADSMDIMRRKLLRQNRELAKANATHLSRIKSLEADFARSLSENLKLNSCIIELKEELKNSNTRRVADHARDIRSQLESQLKECLSVLETLGQEPPTKRHASPQGRRIARASLSPRSPPQRRPPRESFKDTEARALQEGRLPPIAENKSYPRATLDREQILALCSEAADTTDTVDTTDSPELGPPPLSRYVDTDPVDIGSPRQPLEAELPEATHGSPTVSPSPAPAPPSASAPRTTKKPERNITVRPDPAPTSENVQVEAKQTPKDTPIAPQINAKVGSKRKYSMGDDASKTTKPIADVPKPKEPEERLTTAREQPSGQTLKELASRRREARERMSAPVNPRKPLSTKSTNDDMASPVKSAKAAADNGKAPEKPKPRAARERAAQKIREEAEPEPEPVEVPLASPPPPAPVVDVLPSTETVSMEAVLLSPASPEPTSRMSLPSVRDTPPPTDISSHGETSRPSRRARASVSYAEPNLRDKMRRPTKELYDAVTGQTRYLQRSGSANAEQLLAEGIPVTKRESSDDGSWRQISAALSPSRQAIQRDNSPHSPADGTNTPEPVLSVAKPPRKKRSSSMMSGSISENEGQRAPQQTSSGSTSLEKVDSSQPTPSPERDLDPYEFTTSTPGSDTSRVEPKENAAPVRHIKSSRRLSSVMGEDFKADSTDVPERTRAGGPRKRASMVLPKRNRVDAESLEDSSFESVESVESGDFQDKRSKVSMRRRSMML